jgi:OPT family oligopeptide transporter
MVTAGLTNFALRWRMITRAIGELSSIFSGRRKDRQAPASVEVPMWWFVVGTLLAGVACVVAGIIFFGISWWMGIVGVLLALLLSVVAARATGETDLTPLGAMGKITQLTYGILAPRNMTTNLMTASITGGAACHSADLLSSLKTGYLIGANPRKQTFAQLFGIVVGVLVCVPIYGIMVRTPPFDPNQQDVMAAHVAATANSPDSASIDATASSSTNLLTPQFPAPSAAIWYSVARVLAKGFGELPQWSLFGMLIGGTLGIAIALLEEFLPKRYAKRLPSATGLGLGGVIPPPASIAMFFGSLIGAIWLKAHPKSAGDYLIAGASGLIAGESLTGVTINLAGAAPTVGPALWHSVRALFGG